MAADPATGQPPRHYFDHAANSPLREVARRAWLEASSITGNPAGLHGSARRARAVLEDARELIADRLGAHPTEVILTSGGSEADTLAVLGGIRARADERPRLAVSAVEHPAVLQAVTDWPGTAVLPVLPDGRVDLDAVGGLLDDGFGLVSVQTVNNEIGVLQPVIELAELAHRHGAWFHTDAVQAMIWPGVDFATSAADLVSVSAHKIGGPVGIGALLARRGIDPAPTGWGGRQERDLRSGTQLAALASAFAAALDEAVAQRDTQLARWRDHSERIVRLVSSIAGSTLNRCPGEGSSPAIVNVTFEGILADDVLLMLDQQGIDASVGSACRAGVHQPSEVILALGGSRERALGTVRFSLGHTTDETDLAALEEALPDAVARARRVRH